MRVGLLGAGEKGTARAAVLARIAAPAEGGVEWTGVTDADPAAALALAAVHGVPAYADRAALVAACDVACVAVATPDRQAVAAEALAAGRHVFVEWPPAPSATDAEALARRAEEAGVEVGVARPLPTAALLASAPAGFSPRLLALDWTAGADAAPWPHRLAGALDLCAALARSREVQHLDGEADRGPGGTFRAVAFALRFRNGVWAQALLRDGAVPRVHLHAAGPAGAVEAHALGGPLVRAEASPSASESDPAPALARELADFLAAVAAGRHAPHSVLDALRTMRLTERLLQRLR